MLEKTLFGVSHDSKEELSKILNKIKKYSIKLCGLELPKSYLKDKEHGREIKFFEDIDLYLRGRGVKIIYLENTSLFNYIYSIALVKNELIDNTKDIDNFRKKIKYEVEFFESRIDKYKPPEELYFLKYYYKLYKRALKIINNNSPLERIMQLWRAFNEKRELKMLKEIKIHNPDLVIIGDAHARKLKESLLDYKYISYIDL